MAPKFVGDSARASFDKDVDIVYTILKEIELKNFRGVMVEKYIYKVTNLVNGKAYIGQTVNLKRRIQEHKHDKGKNCPLHRAIVKYGWENFSVDVLYFGSDYNEKEKYYIKYFNTQNKDFGYNIVSGGQDSSGEDNPATKHTLEEINQIKQDLFENKLSLKEISTKYGVIEPFVRYVNSGFTWKDSTYTYPIRPLYKNPLSSEDVLEIKALLRDSDLTFDEIAEKFKVKRYVILSINKGKTYKDKTIDYPIRFVHPLQAKLKDIFYDLRFTDLTLKELSEKYDTSICNMYRLNDGTLYRQKDFNYPLRKLTTARNERGQFSSINQS